MCRATYGRMRFGAGQRGLLDTGTVVGSGRRHKPGAKSGFESVTRKDIACYTWRGAYGAAEPGSSDTCCSSGYYHHNAVFGADWWRDT